jgi:hypothetical protein
MHIKLTPTTNLFEEIALKAQLCPRFQLFSDCTGKYGKQSLQLNVSHPVSMTLS